MTSHSVAAAVERLAHAALAHPANVALRAALRATSSDADSLDVESAGAAPAAPLPAASARALFHALLAVAYRVAVLREAAARRDVPSPSPAGWRGLVGALSEHGPLGALGLPSDASEDVLTMLLAAEVEDAEVVAFLAALATDPVDPPGFGALHEAMLACEPTIAGATLSVNVARRGRRASGSFYTPAALVSWLLDAALEPALDDAERDDASRSPAGGLLALRICDPSCGAGAFLAPAALRVAARLAALRGDPQAVERRHALADVVSHCIYGVDLDALAVFICQATLWLATLGPDTPDEAARAVTVALAAHLRRGDALLGADEALVRAGLPDLAFAAHPGDDRAVATAWRARNRADRRVAGGPSLAPGAPARRPLSPADRDAWCAAFFWPRTRAAPPPPTTGSPHGLAREPGTTALVARLAATHGFFHWDTGFPDAREGFDVMLGNPPFLNQLEQETVAARPAAALLRARFPDEVGAYTDTAALLLLHAARRLRPGGRLGMVQPQSILAAQDTRAVRAALVAFAPPTHVWWSGAHVFPGTAVFVTALALRRGSPGTALVRAHTIAFTPLPPLALDVDALATAETWAPLVADALGAPPLRWRTRGTLADLADATADFRDEYYGLIPYVVDRAIADEHLFPRLVLTGHVDPARSWWGARPVRFGKRAWAAPRVDLAALERDGGLSAWAAARRVPKVLVATQTRVLEAVADPEGAWLTTTPTISVLPRDPGQLWRVAAVLLGPPASAWALTHYGATALAAGAVKLSARQVAAIPLPVDTDAWDAAAGHVAAAHAGVDPARARALLELAGAAMVRAYEGDDSLHAWWLARLPAVGGEEGSAAPATPRAGSRPTR
ncbi:MAG: hypothetical protein Q8P18_33090 [Pseudomonadota bacterium]|nr:hypothetical protein [Pseudomonadota bacterium]